MSDATDPICFYCCQEFQTNGQLNRMPDGRSCPICADRLMDSLPALLPSQGTAESAAAGDEVEIGVESEIGEQGNGVQLRPVQDRPEPA